MPRLKIESERLPSLMIEKREQKQIVAEQMAREEISLDTLVKIQNAYEKKYNMLKTHALNNSFEM